MLALFAGGLLPHEALVTAAACIVVAGAIWHLRGQLRFPGDRQGRQANRERALLTGSGRVYFGFLLGLGVFTHMTTPFVYVMLVVIAAAGRVPIAFAAGIGFGVGRSAPALGGLLMRAKSWNPGRASCTIVAQSRLDRIGGLAAGGLALVLLARLTIG